jgi:hypothetical protein
MSLISRCTVFTNKSNSLFINVIDIFKTKFFYNENLTSLYKTRLKFGPIHAKQQRKYEPLRTKNSNQPITTCGMPKHSLHHPTMLTGLDHSPSRSGLFKIVIAVTV